ncbi:MAG: hypothetical protein MMC23_000487 [Stictis urceolatum]|nr:hypothetical protein [Stictis urceolata]
MADSQPGLTDESHQYQIYVTVGIAGFLQVSTTIIRVIVRLMYKLKLSWDDYFIVLGTCLNVVADAFDVNAAIQGFGRHSKFLSMEQEIQANKYAQLAVIVAIWAKCAIKLSICCFLLNIIKGTHRKVMLAIKILMGLTILTSFISAVLWGLQARPIEALWDMRIPGHRESPEQFIDTLYVIYSFGVFTDLLYSFSPIYFLWNVRISVKRKLIIYALTGSGILVTVVAFLDIGFVREFLAKEDRTWILVNEFICDILERNVGGFISNLPALWIVFRRRDRQQISSPERGGHGYGYSRRAGKSTRGGDSNLDTIDRALGDDHHFRPSNQVTVGKASPQPSLYDNRSSDDGIPLRDVSNPLRIEVHKEYTVQRESEIKGPGGAI